MTLDADVVAAVGELMNAGGLAHRAVLVGGQAIRDWHLQQSHYLAGDELLPVKARSNWHRRTTAGHGCHAGDQTPCLRSTRSSDDERSTPPGDRHEIRLFS
jgi:hypothetical protein